MIQPVYEVKWTKQTILGFQIGLFTYYQSEDTQQAVLFLRF